MSRFKNWKEPEFDSSEYAHKKSSPGFKYGWRCQYHQNLKLGKNVDIGHGTYICAKNGVEIGDDVQIGPFCTIHTNNTEDEVYGPVKIGDNARIGAYTLILPNTVIPPNSRIKARSIIKEYAGNNKTLIWEIPDITSTIHSRTYKDLWRVLK